MCMSLHECMKCSHHEFSGRIIYNNYFQLSTVMYIDPETKGSKKERKYLDIQNEFLLYIPFILEEGEGTHVR